MIQDSLYHHHLGDRTSSATVSPQSGGLNINVRVPRNNRQQFVRSSTPNNGQSSLKNDAFIHQATPTGYNQPGLLQTNSTKNIIHATHTTKNIFQRGVYVDTSSSSSTYFPLPINSRPYSKSQSRFPRHPQDLRGKIPSTQLSPKQQLLQNGFGFSNQALTQVLKESGKSEVAPRYPAAVATASSVWIPKRNLPQEQFENRFLKPSPTVAYSASSPDDWREILSLFNENRLKFFKNSDLHAEKFFVTRNRERLKDMNFEHIGIFKSKQASTHVKNFRFFNNDIQVAEPRFEAQLEHAKSLNHSPPPHNSLTAYDSKILVQHPEGSDSRRNMNLVQSLSRIPSEFNEEEISKISQKKMVFNETIERTINEDSMPINNQFLQLPMKEEATSQFPPDNHPYINVHGHGLMNEQLFGSRISLHSDEKTFQGGQSSQHINKQNQNEGSQGNLSESGQFDDEQINRIQEMFFLNLKEDQVARFESEEFKIKRKQVLLDTILRNKAVQQKDKILIYANLLYQYSPEARLHPQSTREQMTKFLRENKFSYDLEESANRKYTRAFSKLIRLPIFREHPKCNPDVFAVNVQVKQDECIDLDKFFPKKQSAIYAHKKILRMKAKQ